MSIPSLEKYLQEYIQGDTRERFNLKSLPVVSVPTIEEKQNTQKQEAAMIAVCPPKPLLVSREETYMEKLSAIPAIQQLGPLFRSSETIDLTELETEYVVRCVKHVYSKHLVLQFDCVNTLNDQLLENVRVQVSKHKRS